ncbi:hypothetical protein BA177_15710 [Woeseia oceani]|uniref:Uncharacterized protein n=1 Tax=Woeseia oceani TaxID=1548547 RepID=A0A193LIV3_9GAMM|nr:hypothetical protein BA177_15710 [Woeseia oceani]
MTLARLTRLTRNLGAFCSLVLPAMTQCVVTLAVHSYFAEAAIEHAISKFIKIFKITAVMSYRHLSVLSRFTNDGRRSSL